MYLDILYLIESLEDVSSTTRKIQYLCLKNLARLECQNGSTLLNDALLHYADVCTLLYVNTPEYKYVV
jgi:hypothetical protein